MKIKINKLKPVKTPPPTFDLTGLTLVELRTIRIALGELTGALVENGNSGETSLAANRTIYRLWSQLQSLEDQIEN